MKISREGSVFIVIVLMIAVVTKTIGAVLLSAFWLFTGFLVVLSFFELLRSFGRVGNKKMESTKEVTGGQLGMRDIKGSTLKAVEAVWKDLPQHASVHDQELTLAKKLAALPTTATKLPDNMLYLAARKALFEMEKKRGTLPASAVGYKPHATKEEIMRPLTAEEVQFFKEFCDRFNSYFDLSRARA